MYFMYNWMIINYKTYLTFLNDIFMLYKVKITYAKKFTDPLDPPLHFQYGVINARQ